MQEGGAVSEAIERVLIRVCTWLFFGVLLAVLPVIMDLMGEVTRGSAAHWRLAVDRGELLISTAAVAALAIANHLLAPVRKPRLGSTLLACINLSLVVFCTAWYSHISGLVRDGLSYEGGWVATISARLFAGAVVAGLCSTVGLARLEGRHGR